MSTDFELEVIGAGQDLPSLARRIRRLEVLEYPHSTNNVVIAKKDAAQTINNNAWTTVIFNIEVLDIDAQYNNATGVFTALRNGIYQITSAVFYNTTAALVCGEKVELAVYVAAARRFYMDRKDDWACGATSIFPHVSGIALVRVVATETVTVRTHQNSGVNLPLHVATDSFNYLNILRVAPYNP